MSAIGKYAIDEHEFTKLVAFTRGESYEACRDRVSEFFRADQTQEALLTIAQYGGLSTISTTIGGGVAGGFMTGGSAPGIIAGAAVGFGTGFIFTNIAGGFKLINHYEDWKKSVEDKAVVEEFKKIYKDHADLSQYYCPIGLDVIKDPAQLPCGHTFEKNCITLWHDQNLNTKNGPKCPTCKDPFSKTQFSVDVTLIGKIKKSYADVIQTEMTNPQYSPTMLKAFKAVKSDMDQQVLEVLKDVSAQLTLQLNSGKITPQTFARKMREVTELYPKEEDPE